MSDDVPRVDPKAPELSCSVPSMSRWASHFHHRSSSVRCSAAWSVLRADEFFYFFEVRHYEKYAQVQVCNAKLFDSLSQGDHVWQTDMLEVSGRWEGEVSGGLLVPLTYCDGKSHLTNFCLLRAKNDIRKKLDLDLDLIKVHQALNIPAKFHEWP
ncbi:unnamed protein product [Prunus armeniaca]